MRNALWAGIVAGLLGLGGCVAETGDFEPLPGDIDDNEPLAGTDGKTDAWDYRNDPVRLARQGLQYRLSELPRSGRAEQVPWSSTYWPTYEDSTNVRWQGPDRLSPLELYDQAFNGWRPPEGFMSLRPMTECGGAFDRAYYEQLGPAARWMSENRGNGRMRNGRDDDGDGQIDECGDDMDGIESWWGLCHAWVPAAILEPEPLHGIDYNGTRFEVSDITALLITAYDRTDALMLGGRCNARTVERDDNGRPRASECGDTNPGAMHVIFANFLGINRRALAMDRTYDFEVWNQPVIGYEVRMLERRTPEEAMAVLGIANATSYTFNPRATELYEVRMDVQWITESGASIRPSLPTIDRYTRTDRYHYILEVDARGKIIGGEWAPDSRTLHPDFLWVPVRAVSGGNPHVRLDRVRELLRLSREPVGPAPTPTSGNTIANDVPVTIPDNQAEGVRSVITVPAGSGTVGGLTVQVEIEHTYRGDLRVTLEHAGRSVTLHANEGGNAQNLTLTRALAEFDGTPREGAWTLHVADTARADTGRLVRWSLTFHGAQNGGGTTGGTGGSTSTGPRTYRATDPAREIPDNDPNGISMTLTVPDAITIRSLQVGVDVQHPYRGDLVVTVEHAGRTVTLHDRAGGSADDLVQQFSVADFAGMDARGTWTLRVSDRAAADVGRLRGFTITVE